MSETIAAQLGLREMPHGMSSSAILAVKLGLPANPTAYPYDPSDLGRCLSAHGDTAPEMMRGVHPVWDAYLDNWDELVNLLHNERADRSDTKRPRLYKRMSELQERVRRERAGGNQ